MSSVALDRETIVRHADGSDEVLGFHGPPGGVCFVALHRPARPTGAGAVVCSPVHAEQNANYRKEVVLARALAAAGIAVARFHYRGTGNSDACDEMTVGTMIDDAAAVAELLRATAGIERPAVVGTRLGAIVAAAVAAPGAPLVLWQPVVAPARYLRAVLRTRAVGALAGGDEPSRSPAHELAARGEVDVVGFLIRQPFYESVMAADIEGALPPGPRPILLVQLQKSTEISAEHAGLADRWRAAGLDVTVMPVAKAPQWWFREDNWEPSEEREETRELVGLTTDWLSARLALG
ncbi:MAG: hypothetical protein JWO37_3907 [Acidimicrobiales bacterium]|nr:hypothetical protein [Acidimicrobiales bacterium]